ncbi:MAG: (Fe-S)-binding protein [Candidatus Lokiarchaeia archaeon]|nr:(Fe-S)-binding protein [Candidatus Lokiarchaeia archaeon]
MVDMRNLKRISGFREELCNLCGVCLNLCPVLQLPIESAKEEIKNLIEGKESKYALTKCNTCFSCNLYCPQKANPYNLILERWNDLYKKRAAPPLYRFVCPTEQNNIWQLLNIFLSNQERKWIHNWITYNPKPDDTILLVGNYTHLFPFILGGSRLLDYFKPIDRIDQWEGGAYLYQGGYLDVVQKISQRTKKDFDDWGVKKVIACLDAVEYIFNEVHPKEMGVEHSQEFINFNHWLLDKINSSEIQLVNQLDMSVTVHDNCYSKTLSGKYWEIPREILEKCGCNLIEMKHNKKNSLCCGFGAGASWVKNISIIFDIITEGLKKFKEAEETGAKALVSYCGGCIYLLWASKELLRSNIEIFHVIEIVRMAMGEKLNYPQDHINRAWDIIAIMTYSLFLSLFSKNFYITELIYDKQLSTFKPKKYRLLKALRYILNFPKMKLIFTQAFHLLRIIFKSK